MDVFWNGISAAEARSEGYKIAEEEIFQRLSKKGLSIGADNFASVNKKIYIDSNYHISHVTERVSDVRSKIFINNKLPTEYIKTNSYNIGFSYWETNKLPSEWVPRMNEMDEIWTTSLWAKQVFIESGVKKPVFSFSLGVNSDIYKPFLSERKNPFTFMSIGSPSTRKNSQMTVDAYIKLFGGRDDVRLIYKSIGSPDARSHPKTVHVKPLSQRQDITVIETDLDSKSFGELYDSVNCLVYPTSGEGWGMLPYQSIAKGIPTICTNATACTEYASLSVPLDFEWGSSKMPGIYQNAGQWAEPNFEDLCDKMLYVYNHYEEVADMTYNNSLKNYQFMTWDYAAEGYYKRLCQILKKLGTKL